ENDNDIEKMLGDVRSAHSTANHICYAFRRGVEQVYSRNNDDGEPSGTAGKPILEVINRKGLTNTLIVVVRYFGGILLGRGKLARTYKDVAVEAVKNSEIDKMEHYSVYEFVFDHQDYSLAGKYFRDKSYIIEHLKYDDMVRATVAIPTLAKDKTLAELRALAKKGLQSNFSKTTYYSASLKGVWLDRVKK
ncbi:MAG: YigZ family protein, partial [Clostridia bacterium]